jgi:hypothetical protein
VPSLLAVGCTDQQVGQFVADLTAELAPIQPVLNPGGLKSSLVSHDPRQPLK